MRFPKKFFKKVDPKIVLWALVIAGFLAFLLKDYVFKKPYEPYMGYENEQVIMPSEKPLIKKAPVESVKHGKAYMAIILDDWGTNYSLLRLALEIKRPLTLAVIPNLPNSRRIAEEAHKNNLGVMIHMPMQPMSSNHPLEPHTILTTTPDAEIQKYLAEAVLSIPQAEGLNNHMGSAVTCDLRAMRTILKYLKVKGLFFVDSKVIAQTVGPKVALEVGVPFAKRDVFIDNKADADEIKKQLMQAAQIALRRGRVVVIGHDRKTTLQAIKEAVPELEKQGIHFVLVRDLVA